MAYIVPRVLITQEFNQVPVFTTQPLAAFIIGPQYNLNRYSVAAEKENIGLGIYQPGANTAYNFPNQVGGTFVDEAYVKVYFDNAVAQYYPTDLGSTTGEVTRVAAPNGYYTNRLQATNLVFKTANSENRSADFAQRDVAPGDLVTIHCAADSNTTLTTRVKALHADKSASSVTSPAVKDTANTASQSEISGAASVTSHKDSGSGVTVANASTAYKGAFNYLNGTPIISDTYTATVTTGGNLSAARFVVTSAQGAFAPTAPAAVDGSDLLVLDANNSNVVKLNFTGSTLFTASDTFSVTVQAPVVSTVVPTAAGTFTGPANITYKLTVVRGGPFYNGTNGNVCARVAVTSNNMDSSATQSAGHATAFQVGNYHVTATFANGPIVAGVNGGLLAGDVYYITAQAAAPDKTNIIETYDTLPTNFVNGTKNYTITALSYVANLEIPAAAANDSVDLNWTITGQSITINEGVVTYNPAITNGVDLLPLDVTAGNIYVEHRDLVTTNSVAVKSVTDATQVEAVLGTVDPDNVLAQGVYDAALNAAGVPVYFTAVATNDLNGYNAALALAKKSTKYYGITPLTFDETIHEAVISHVNAMSTPMNARWRVAWISKPAVPTELIYNALAGGDPYQATITADPNSATTEYTLLTVTNMPAGHGFITDGVRVTDQVLINFRTDALENTLYDTYTVAEVRTENTLLLAAGPAAAINSPTKVQVQRIYTPSEQAETLAAIAGSYSNRRVRVVFPDTAKNVDVVKPGYFLAAALAGLRSGVVPQQGLTNTQVLGLTDLSEVIKTFTEDDLNTMAERGVWIVTQEVIGGTPYVRHQLTSDQSSLNTSEDSITTDVDSISLGLQAVLEPFIGTWNVNTGSIGVIRSVIDGELRFRLTQTGTIRAGNQLTGYKILDISQDPTFPDRINVSLRLFVPYPVNFINVTLVV